MSMHGLPQPQDLQRTQPRPDLGWRRSLWPAAGAQQVVARLNMLLAAVQSHTLGTWGAFLQHTRRSAVLQDLPLCFVDVLLVQGLRSCSCIPGRRVCCSDLLSLRAHTQLRHSAAAKRVTMPTLHTRPASGTTLWKAGLMVVGTG